MNTEKCCLNHDTKHIFFVLFTLKTCFSTTLFKPQFSHLFKQQFLKTMTKRALNVFLLIPFSYSELPEIATHYSYHSKFFSFNFFAIVCVLNVFVAKMTKPCCECSF